MKKDQLLEILKEIGLSETEASVYLSSLSLGPSTVMKVASGASVKRSTAYSVIESLEKKGLMNIEVNGFKKLYVPANPDKLESVLESRKEKFHSALPEFSALYNLQGSESFIKHYRGWENSKEIFTLLLADLVPGDKYTVFSNAAKWDALDPIFLQKFRDKRAKMNLDLRLILEDDPKAREFKKFEKNMGGKIKLLPKGTVLDADTITTPHRVAFLQIIEPIASIVIENKTVIDAHQKMFDIMWNALPD